MIDSSKISYWKIGKHSAWAVGILFILATVGIGIDPIGMVAGYTMEGVVAKDVTIDMIWRSLFALIGVVNIVMFTAIAAAVRDKEGKSDACLLVTWIIGIFSGFAGSLNWTHFVHVVTLYKKLYVSGVDVASFYNNPVFPIDSYYIWTFGAMGVFMIFAHRIALKFKSMPPSLAWWGIVTGIVSFIIPITYILELKIAIGPVKLSAMIITGGLCGGILAPVYCFRLASYFKRKIKDGNEA